MEAMWTRFCPAVVRLRELVADGAIGEVCTVTADLWVRHPVDPATQFYHPESSGLRLTVCVTRPTVRFRPMDLEVTGALQFR